MAGIFTSLFGSATGGGGGGGGGDVSSVNGMKGAVVITGENTRATVNGQTKTVTEHLVGVKSLTPSDASADNQLLTTAVVIKEYS